MIGSAMERAFSWDELNAYVDGEVDPTVAADIATAATADRAVAETIAAIARLKAASRSALQADPAEVPPIRTPAKGLTPTILTSGRVWALAAFVLVAVALGGVSWHLLRPLATTSVWTAEGTALYAEWFAAGGAGSDPDTEEPGSSLARLSISGAWGYVPDLTAARMRVAHVATSGGTNGGLFVGYVGRNGCRLGLWVGVAPESAPSELTVRRDANGLTMATWRIGATGYAAMARNMDEGRFQAIVRYLEFVTRQGPRGRDSVRTAEVERRAAAPCLS